MVTKSFCTEGENGHEDWKGKAAVVMAHKPNTTILCMHAAYLSTLTLQPKSYVPCPLHTPCIPWLHLAHQAPYLAHSALQGASKHLRDVAVSSRARW